MLAINMTDVINVLNSCKPYLIFAGVILVLAVVITIAVKKLDKPKKKLTRSTTWLAAGTAVAIAVNLICCGPMSSLLSLASGSGTISEESSAEATELCEAIAEEGIVLLKNEYNALPLSEVSKLNVFGWASTNPCYGGTGSGALSDAYPTVTLLQGLENAGFELNTELSEFYTEYRADRPEVGMWEQDWTLPEPPADTYSNEMMNRAKEFSDTAVVVVSRVGGENSDLPVDVSQVTYNDNSEDYKDFEAGEHYLQLSKSERDMLELVCGNFENVIFVYNGANAMELGFLNEYEQIRGALWCPGTGQSGFNALGRILSGEVNPSGKTPDTFVADLTSIPSANNFGSFVYDNMTEFNGFDGANEPTTPTFVNYVEGIYVGYRFYETAAQEGLIRYDEHVVYPFGYGLSYTEFEQEMGPISEADGKISFNVTVTNVGDTAGKDVVEVYYNPPYTNGGIEKSSVNLIEFDKTELLQPGESQTINIEFNIEEMASYDAYNEGAYVLESGDYKISIRLDSHNIIDEQIYTIGETVVYDEQNPRSSDETAAVNQFEDVEGNVTYLSRTDGFANYDEATAAPSDMSMPEEYKEKFIINSNYAPEDYNDPDDSMPITGADNGMTLADMRGLDYDDEKWDKLLDQLTVDEMDEMIALAGFQTLALDSIDKIQTVDCDGPASINNNFTQTGSIGFPSGVMIASTWNTTIAEKFGESIGRMADDMNVSGWYAPAMNLHRNAFAGRNFEYYSEDGLLSGDMAANAVIGAEKYGVYAYIKHYALNDQEINRAAMLCTWATEQSIREIYLKPFEIAVKDGHAKAVMSAYNFIGVEPAQADPELLITVLRDEWGFRGFVESDWYGDYGYQDADRLIRNGNDAMLASYDIGTNYLDDTESATGVQAMRQAAKNILYTVVNSRAYEEENMQTGLMIWQIILIAADVVLAVIVITLELIAVKKYRKRTSKRTGIETEKM